MAAKLAEDDDVIICGFSPPPPKRPKCEGPGVEVAAEPLRCSTPQPPGGEEENGEDLDKTLEDLGISHDSIEIFIDEVGGTDSSQTSSTANTTSTATVCKIDHTHCNNTNTGNEDIDVALFGVNDEYAKDFLRDVSSAEEKDQGIRAAVGGVPEVVEVILGQLPISHLYGSCRLVCRKWNAIILREKFLYWKKMYYKYKSGRDVGVTQKVTALSEQLWPGMQDTQKNASLETVTVPLVQFVSEQFKDMAVSPGAARALLTHPQSHCVARIRELCPTIHGQQGSADVATIALLVVCSWSVSEVRAIIASLLTSSSLHCPPCDRLKVLELFYCLATLFCVGCEGLGKLPMRLHYHVFYALNVLERGCGVPTSELARQCTSGQQSLFKYCDVSSRVLTVEQAQVVNYKMQPGEVIKVLAFAGTGKTTTLLKFTALNPNKRFLYCVYNKSVQEHASSLFPDNVKCQTFHSLAHGSRGDPTAFGWKYLSKRGTLSSYTISQSLDQFSKKSKFSLFLLSKHIFQTLEKFVASGDDMVIDEHIPKSVKMSRNEIMPSVEYAEKVRQLNDPEYRGHVLREAQNVWKRMVDLGDKSIRMTDDGYLKLFQLSRPQIRGYDCILVDEGQDLTPAIISLITTQMCSKIFVGDTHQQIYGFRGATNALEQIRASRVFHLTESFRFGPEIAYVAACTLSSLKGIWRQTLVGSTHAGTIDGTQCGQVAIIARLNATLFEEMVKTVRSKRSLKLGFAGGIQKYEFDMYLDIYKLLHGRKKEIKHKVIKKWDSFTKLANYANRTDDVALINKIKICERYTDLPSLIEKIKSMYSRDMTLADIVFSTAHKSRGLEFDTVKLTDDYGVYDEEDRETHGIARVAHPSGTPNGLNRNPEIEEKNLLYVAVTRAKKSLILTHTLVRVLREAKEYFVYPSMENAALPEGMCSVCRLTRQYPSLCLHSLPSQGWCALFVQASLYHFYSTFQNSISTSITQYLMA